MLEFQATHRMLASSLLMRFSSSSRALAFLRSAMNCTSPRMLELLLLERPRKPPAAEDAMANVRYQRMGDQRQAQRYSREDESRSFERVGSPGSVNRRSYRPTR